VVAIARQLPRAPLQSAADTSSDFFRVQPTDIDVFRHVNHARYLNYMEAARWGFMARSGFLRLGIRRGWVAPLRSVHVEYFRPLTLGRRFEVRTQFVRFQERWFFLLHRVLSGDREIARALVQGTVRKGRENVPPEEYLAPLGFHAPDARVPADVAEWVEGRIALLGSGDGA
jgi:YbgC/YbaW family acyl-CoA thioester hydrolase